MADTVYKTFYLAPTTNFLQKTLNGAITDSASTITLNNTTNVQGPGYAVINRVDSSGTVLSSTVREVISYTGVSGNDLTGVTRGADNGTARSHGDGSVVEFVPTAGMFNSLVTIVSTAMTGDGYLKAINSPVSIGRLESSFVRAPAALVSVATILGHLQISGASISGIGIYPVWRSANSYSGPTIGVGGILKAPRAATLQWVSVVTRFVASGTSVGIDIMKNGTSIFANATMRPAIAAGGTYVSTASINTKNIDRGSELRADVASLLAGAGMITDITIQAGTE